MKHIKYIMLTILFFLFITTMTEVNLFNSNFLIKTGDCNTHYAFDLETHDKAKNRVFLETFAEKAKERGLGIYVVYETIKNHNEKTYLVYGNQKAERLLKKRLEVNDNPIKLDSFFMGHTTVEFKSFQELDPRSIYTIQFFGDIENAREIRTELVDQYSPSAVYPGGDLRGIAFTKKGILGIVLVIVLLLSVYYTISRKKEYAIRTVLGESALFWRADQYRILSSYRFPLCVHFKRPGTIPAANKCPKQHSEKKHVLCISNV